MSRGEAPFNSHCAYYDAAEEAEATIASTESWNPRYLAYSAAHLRTPAEQLRHDVAEYPGGCMAGFLIWIKQRWRQWRALNGFGPEDILGSPEVRQFDAWLEEFSGRCAAV